MIQFSIAIATIPTRYPMLARLLRDLNYQIHDLGVTENVEILTDDSITLSTGAKRNNLYRRAMGNYIATVDDDDSVYSDYIRNILEATKSNPDAIAMNGIMTTNGRDEKKWFIAKDNPYEAQTRFDGSQVYARFHNHLSPIKSEIARAILFPDSSMGEDYSFAKRLHESGLIKTESIIGTNLQDWMRGSMLAQPKSPQYHYRYITNKPPVIFKP